ncbi:hypothetical protein [uncultured Sulfitobacter sp.]|uniref:hypothetical protein n=1 Tax=uncultured Sulfitobacter sp. TaxID=191468 RepID=UPI00261079CA|nr:hypothetical protein [uncultured Sulfitobacter sp.]
MKRLVIGLAVAAIVAGCSVDQNPDSSDQAVAAAAFRAGGPTSLTLVTVVNNRTGAGGHTALIVNGSQQVIFDPAGSFRDERVVEKGDVLYGMTPGWVKAFKSAHARVTHHVVSQTVDVTPEQAERALNLVRSNGSVAGAYCANSTSGILAQIDGFQGINRTFYPVKLMDQFALVPGVRTDTYYENDEGDVIDAVTAVKLATSQS